ncbi:methyl-accepting chemotaxis protein [Azonexus fungiphilus]|uniref:Methyl-accepting chemotaxis protein n=1 Tax=Azonexus fungiphilus TaxID=146940 RepID=A0A495VTU3_9RHOO|nr:methyl-accepting chemotaxis protein [Azonexus fungiphilus]RKT51098.1 methyl-accepting chemotaxis protein [Azonexus fungiphilus]
MKNLFRLGIGRQLAIAFTLVVGQFLIVAAWTAFSLARVDEAAGRIATVSLAKEEQIAALNLAYARMRESVRNNIIFTDAEVMQREMSRYTAEKGQFLAALTALDGIAATHAAPGEREILQRIRAQSQLALQHQDQAMAEAMQFLSAVAMGILQQETMPRMLQLDQSLGELRSLVQAQSRERAADIVAESGRTTRLVLVLAVLSAVLAGLLGWVLTRAVSRPLQATAQLMEEVAAGDLGGRIEIAGCAEIRRVQEAALRTTRTLARILGDIRNEASGLQNAATTLATTTDGMRHGAREQSQAAAAMAATLQDMAERIAEVAALGSEARELAGAAGSEAGKGHRTITTMVAEMERIAASVEGSALTAASLGVDSQRISAITSVIHDLADQTNLLALNAAIEAARAGESGRGFAVVADEVRKLAEKTTASASQIAAMVQAIQGGAQAMGEQMQRSVEQVKAGLGMARQAGASMQSIDDGSRRVAAVIGEVSGKLSRQAQAGDEVGQRVDGIVCMVRASESASDALAATAGELDRLAGALAASTARFRTA